MMLFRAIVFCAAISACSSALLNLKPGATPGAAREPAARAPDASPSAASVAGAETGAAPPSSSSSGPSPAYIADKRRECTFHGAVNEGCVALYVEAVSGDNPLHISNDLIEDLRACFYEVAQLEKSPDGTDAAESKIVRGTLSKDPAYDNKYVAGCLAAAGTAHGPDWVRAVQTVANWKVVARDVDKTFEAKCGLRARMSDGDSGGLGAVSALARAAKYVPSMSLEKASRRGGLFYDAAEPIGGKLTVRCNGTVERKLPDGQLVKAAPTTWKEEQRQLAQHCVSQCTDSRLLSGGACWQMSKPACNAYCQTKCQ
jgi:hypothetical protein